MASSLFSHSSSGTTSAGVVRRERLSGNGSTTHTRAASVGFGAHGSVRTGECGDFAETQRPRA
eukprot:13420895-Alexandrium_andersonii.AAC.1